MSKAELSEQDVRLLKLLYKDASLTNEEIASKLSMKVGQIQDRIQQLIQDNVIRGFSAVIDPVKVGFSISTYHFVELSENFRHVLESAADQTHRWQGTQLVMFVLGNKDVIVRGIFESDSRLDRYATNAFSYDEIRPINVTEMVTYRISHRHRWRGVDIRTDRSQSSVSYELDDAEKQLLKLLQDDSTLRESPERIADQVDLHTTKVKSTIREFESNKVILNYSVDINFNNTDFRRGFIGLNVGRGKYEEATKQILTRDSFSFPYIQSGLGLKWADLAVEVVFRTLSELEQFVNDLRSLKGVKAASTFVGTSKTYYNEGVPLE